MVKDLDLCWKTSWGTIVNESIKKRRIRYWWVCNHWTSLKPLLWFITKIIFILNIKLITIMSTPLPLESIWIFYPKGCRLSTKAILSLLIWLANSHSDEASSIFLSSFPCPPENKTTLPHCFQQYFAQYLCLPRSSTWMIPGIMSKVACWRK